jgi:hypothetical protein
MVSRLLKNFLSNVKEYIMDDMRPGFNLECKAVYGFTMRVYLEIRAKKMAKKRWGFRPNRSPIRPSNLLFSGHNNCSLLSNIWDNIIQAYEDVYPSLDDEKSRDCE